MKRIIVFISKITKKAKIVKCDVDCYDRGETRIVGDKGRVHIPSEIRHILNINDGDSLAFRIEKNEVIASKVVPRVTVKPERSGRIKEATNGKR